MSEKFSRPFKLRPDMRKDEVGRMREQRGLFDAKTRAQQVSPEILPEDMPFPKREINNQDRKAISLINKVVKGLRSQAGINDDWYITEDRFTFYQAPFPVGPISPANAHNLFDRIKIVEFSAGLPKGAHYLFMLHEMVHLGAYSVLVGVNGELRVRKMGFHLHDHDLVAGEDIGSMVFLDEAVVQGLTTEILQIQRMSFAEELGLTEDEIDQLIDFSKNRTYVVPTITLNKIVRGVARTNKVSDELVWNACKASYFNSDLSFLRDIERTFGPGTLRLLDVLDSKIIPNPDTKEKINLIKEYFSIDTNPIKRFNIALQLMDGVQQPVKR